MQEIGSYRITSEQLNSIKGHCEILNDILDAAQQSNIAREYRIGELEDEVKRLREALQFYANEEHYDENGAPGYAMPSNPDNPYDLNEWETDEGLIAREALK